MGCSIHAWFIKKFHEYLSTINELYLYKDLSRECFSTKSMEQDMDDNNYVSEYLYKDRSIIIPKISLKDISLYRTKSEWLMSKLKKSYKDQVYVNFNKFPLLYSYGLICIAPFISEEGFRNYQARIPMLINKNFLKDSYVNTFSSKNKFAKTFIVNYYASFIDNIDLDEDLITIRDMLYPYFEGNYKGMINLVPRGMNRILQEHNRMIDEINYNENQERIQSIHTQTNSIFNPLQRYLPSKEFEWIQNGERLYQEGREQHNCVFSYGNLINSDKSAIYSANINKHRYTIEFCYNQIEKSYFIAQMYLACNHVGPDEDRKYVDRLIAEINERNNKEDL